MIIFIIKQKQYSMECLQCICCCFNFQPSPQPRLQRPKTRKSAKQNRLTTKYTKQEIVRISDQDRKSGKVKAYCCPICTYYYNRILACGQCTNCLCLTCFQSYDQKNVEKRTRMKCPFCNSVRSIFSDYELDPHSYFDTTNKGFLSKEQRLKIDNQIAHNAQPQLEIVPQQSEQVLQPDSREP